MTKNLEKTLSEIGHPGRIFFDYKEYSQTWWLYALYDNEKLIYLGITRDIHGRIRAHKKDKKFSYVKCLMFDKHRLDIQEIERRLIERHDPPLNINGKAATRTQTYRTKDAGDLTI